MRGKCFMFCIVMILLLCANLSAKTITDMYGNRVAVPDKITRVFSVSRSLTPMLYTIAPDLIVGVNSKVKGKARAFYSKSYLELPELGGSGSTGTIMNYEVLLKIKPDIVLVWGNDRGFGAKAEDSIKAMGFPLVRVNIDGMNHYAESYLFLGKLLGREKRGRELSEYASKAMSEVKAAVDRVPKAKRVTVYYAAGSDGLTSACEDSWHAELIPLAGGINPVKCIAGHFTGFEKLTIESIMLINPDTILVLNKAVKESVLSKRVWRDIKAAKDKRIYLAPALPMNWFDGPPSFMGIIGLKWLSSSLYPEYYSPDMEKETAKFMELFFSRSCSSEEIKDILETK